MESGSMLNQERLWGHSLASNTMRGYAFQKSSSGWFEVFRGSSAKPICKLLCRQMREASVELEKLGSGEQDNTDGPLQVEMSQFRNKLDSEILIGVGTELVGSLIFVPLQFLHVLQSEEYGDVNGDNIAFVFQKFSFGVDWNPDGCAAHAGVNAVTQFKALLTRCQVR